MAVYHSDHATRPEPGRATTVVAVAQAPAPAVITPCPYLPAVTAAVLRKPTGPIRNLAELNAALARTDRPNPPIYAALAAELGLDPAPTVMSAPAGDASLWFGGAR
ncbi:hypothetical protein [Actinoplanes sp. NPDC051851]|uniref:hypothetical protein n=1 Tax=Actinoplanes sp. NPDC051851 TaxID=3154753 RepID=UPI0034477493